MNVQTRTLTNPALQIKRKEIFLNEWCRCYWPGFLASLINRNWSEVRWEIQVRLCWGSWCSRREWEQSPARSCWVGMEWGGGGARGRAVSVFLTWHKGRGGSRGWARGAAWVVCPPLPCCCVQAACAVFCFCSQLFRSGSRAFWSFCILPFIICSNDMCTQLFLSPL